MIPECRIFAKKENCSILSKKNTIMDKRRLFGLLLGHEKIQFEKIDTSLIFEKEEEFCKKFKESIDKAGSFEHEEEGPLFILTTETGLVFIGQGSSYQCKPASDDLTMPACYSVRVRFICATKSTTVEMTLDTFKPEWFKTKVMKWAEGALADKKVVSYQ